MGNGKTAAMKYRIRAFKPAFMYVEYLLSRGFFSDEGWMWTFSKKGSETWGGGVQGRGEWDKLERERE